MQSLLLYFREIFDDMIIIDNLVEKIMVSLVTILFMLFYFKIQIFKPTWAKTLHIKIVLESNIFFTFTFFFLCAKAKVYATNLCQKLNLKKNRHVFFSGQH